MSLLKWTRLKNHLMGASKPLSDIWEVFGGLCVSMTIFILLRYLSCAQSEGSWKCDLRDTYPSRVTWLVLGHLEDQPVTHPGLKALSRGKQTSKIKSTIHWRLGELLATPWRQPTFHSSSAKSFFRPSKLSMKVLLKYGRSKSCAHDWCSVTQRQRYFNSVRHSRGNGQHTWIKPFTWSSILTTGFCSLSVEEAEGWEMFRVLVYIACYFLHSVEPD